MFVQLTFAEFKRKYPSIYRDMCETVDKEVMKELECDNNYLVRVAFNDEVEVEVGYASDNWAIA